MASLLLLLPRLRPTMLLLLILAIMAPLSMAQEGSDQDVISQEVDIDIYQQEETSLKDTSSEKTSINDSSSEEIALDDTSSDNTSVNDTSIEETGLDDTSSKENHGDAGVDYNIENVKASIEGQVVSLDWDSVDAAEYVIYREYLASDDEDEDESDLSASNMERNVKNVDKTSSNYASLKQAPCQKARYGVSLVINNDYGSKIFWSNPVKTTDLDRKAKFKPTNLKFDTSNFNTIIDEDHHEYNDTEAIIITWDHSECIERYEIEMCMLAEGMEEFVMFVCDKEDVDVTEGDDEVRYTTMMEPCTIHKMKIKPILMDLKEQEEGSGDSGSGSGDFMGSGEIIGTVEADGEVSGGVIDDNMVVENGDMVVESNDVSLDDEKGSGDESDDVSQDDAIEVYTEVVWTGGSEEVEFSTPGHHCPLVMSSADLFVSSAGPMSSYLYTIVSAISILNIPFLV